MMSIYKKRCKKSALMTKQCLFYELIRKILIKKRQNSNNNTYILTILALSFIGNFIWSPQPELNW